MLGGRTKVGPNIRIIRIFGFPAGPNNIRIFGVLANPAREARREIFLGYFTIKYKEILENPAREARREFFLGYFTIKSRKSWKILGNSVFEYSGPDPNNRRIFGSGHSSEYSSHLIADGEGP